MITDKETKGHFLCRCETGGKPPAPHRLCPTGITPVRTGHVFGDGGVASIAGSAHVGGHTLAAEQYIRGKRPVVTLPGCNSTASARLAC